jgi:hypothetical protein
MNAMAHGCGRRWNANLRLAYSACDGTKRGPGGRRWEAE